MENLGDELVVIGAAVNVAPAPEVQEPQTEKQEERWTRWLTTRLGWGMWSGEVVRHE